VRASFLIFLVVGFRQDHFGRVSPWCPCAAFLIEEDSGREARRLFFRLTLNPETLGVEVEKVRCEPLSLFFWLLDFDGTTSVVSPLVSLCRAFFLSEEDSGREAGEGYFFV
jgi:hypothetical protein